MVTPAMDLLAALAALHEPYPGEGLGLGKEVGQSSGTSASTTSTGTSIHLRINITNFKR